MTALAGTIPFSIGGQLIHNRPLPLTDVSRMHLILAGNLSLRLDSRQCFKSQFNLEGRLMSQSFRFNLVFCRFSAAIKGGCPSDTKNLT